MMACGGSDASSPAAAAPTVAPRNPNDPKHPDSDKVTWKKDAPYKSCHTGSKGDGDLVAAVTAMATSCVSGMHQLGQPITGNGADMSNTEVKQIPLAAQANHCYRAFGLAESTVKDLDVAVMDSNGKRCAEDLNDNNDAIVLEDGSFCFTVDDKASVNVAVASGAGKWAVEIWSD